MQHTDIGRRHHHHHSFIKPTQDYMSQYPDIQYCKTDLISAKGIVFCKFSKASSALHAMELVNETGIVRVCFFCACVFCRYFCVCVGADFCNTV